MMQQFQSQHASFQGRVCCCSILLQSGKSRSLPAREYRLRRNRIRSVLIRSICQYQQSIGRILQISLDRRPSRISVVGPNPTLGSGLATTRAPETRKVATPSGTGQDTRTALAQAFDARRLLAAVQVLPFSVQSNIFPQARDTGPTHSSHFALRALHLVQARYIRWPVPLVMFSDRLPKDCRPGCLCAAIAQLKCE